jgi:putative transcriptional regulator
MHRLSAGLTQRQLADSAEVSRQTIVSIERGDYAPSTVLALRLSLLLDVPVDSLFALPDSEVETLAVRRERLLTLARSSGKGGSE